LPLAFHVHAGFRSPRTRRPGTRFSSPQNRGDSGFLPKENRASGVPEGSTSPRHVRVRTFISGNTVSTLCYLYKKTNFSGGTEQKATVGQKPVKSHDLSRSGYREGKRVRPARGAAPRPHPSAEAGGVLRNLGFGKNVASRQVNGFAKGSFLSPVGSEHAMQGHRTRTRTRTRTPCTGLSASPSSRCLQTDVFLPRVSSQDLRQPPGSPEGREKHPPPAVRGSDGPSCSPRGDTG